MDPTRKRIATALLIVVAVIIAAVLVAAILWARATRCAEAESQEWNLACSPWITVPTA